MIIPRLTTERLVLRAPEMTDWPDYAAFLASERSRFMGGPFAGWAAWGMFSSDVAMWSLYGHGALMIDRRDTGVCVGQVGINHGPMFPEKELGWLLYAGHEGKGYATEAGAAMRDWAFTTLGLETLVSYFDASNSRSMAVSARLGGVRDPEARTQDEGDVVFRYNRGDDRR
ncbi:MAG: GNAT family N-acetyltransferase [Devosia sp.]|uniref:GNAT family N-acetyltransferase n=1 Tax=Devosia sp. TaxID=1871048 RepID=UPI0024CACC67|nr:GNAT family N-acetyltransferase [Devosia sp.]UYO00422.1 MAG: GNAT family N-acetyltransferase [Devosia sp.]